MNINLICDAVAIVIAFLIFLQDFRSREVSLWLFSGLLFSGSIKYYLSSDYYSLLFNLGFLLLLYLVASLVLKIRGKKITQSIGLGDNLFFLICALFFTTFGFIVFMNTSFITALIGHFLLPKELFSKKHFEIIPLAGYAGIVLAIFLILPYFGLDLRGYSM